MEKTRYDAQIIETLRTQTTTNCGVFLVFRLMFMAVDQKPRHTVMWHAKGQTKES